MKKRPGQVFDELLVHRYKSGDTAAMSLLIKRWQGKIKRQITRHTHEQQVAEDVAQEAWEVILTGIYNLREPALFGIWALRIATRKAIDWIRERQKEREMRKETNYIPDHGDDITEHTISLIRGALKELPESHKVILQLFYLEKYDVAEIAAVIEIPVGTVKSRLFYARQQLKDIIKQKLHENENR